MKNLRLVLQLEIRQSHTAAIIRKTSTAVEKEMLSEMLPQIEASFKKWLSLQMRFLDGTETAIAAEEDLSTDDEAAIL